jgi:hypothetical protein
MEEMYLPFLQPEEGSPRAALAAAMAGRGMVSYRDLPLGLFQIGTRFKDEDRPCGGVLKTRESVTCEGWVFRATEEESRQQIESLKDVLGALLKQCGLNCLAVEGIPEQGATRGLSIELLGPAMRRNRDRALLPDRFRLVAATLSLSPLSQPKVWIVSLDLTSCDSGASTSNRSARF